MKMIFLILLFIAGTIKTCATNVSIDYTEEERQYIVYMLKKYAPHKDSNPTHQEDADRVNSIFIQALDGLNNYTNEEKGNLRIDTFMLLYDNSVSLMSSDDSADANRKAKKRSLCYMALSLLSDKYRYDFFTKDAINTISSIHMLEDKYTMIAIIRLLEILLIYQFENENTIQRELEEKYIGLQDFINAEKDYILEDFVSDFSVLMLKFK